jgi:hypothetical protein
VVSFKPNGIGRAGPDIDINKPKQGHSRPFKANQG